MARFWETIQIWKKKPMQYKEGREYRFTDLDDSDITAIELLLDNYENVVYHYHQARVVEEGDVARLQFGYTILSSGKHDIDTLNADTHFQTIMGDILSHLLMAIKDEQIRADNSKKLDIQ